MRIRDGKNSDPGWKKFGSGINIPDSQHCPIDTYDTGTRVLYSGSKLESFGTPKYQFRKNAVHRICTHKNPPDADEAVRLRWASVCRPPPLQRTQPAFPARRPVASPTTGWCWGSWWSRVCAARAARAVMTLGGACGTGPPRRDGGPAAAAAPCWTAGGRAQPALSGTLRNLCLSSIGC